MSKPLDRLTLLSTFVRIADTGSISAAARDLNLSQPTASRQLAELESRLKTQLVRRTTHSLSLTTAGTALLGDARALLDGWEALQERHLADEGVLSGALKVVAPIGLGQRLLAHIAWRFLRDHPHVTLDWILDDDPIRFAEVGCDCWIRVGPVPDDTLIVRTLAIVERLLVAAPAAIGTQVTRPRDAERMDLIALTPFEGTRIELRATDDGRRVSIAPALRMSTNNIVALKEATLAGLGMAVMPRWFVDAELEDGSLVDLLPAWRAPTLRIQVAYLPGRHQPRRLRAFLDALGAAVPEISGVDPPALA